MRSPGPDLSPAAASALVPACAVAFCAVAFCASLFGVIGCSPVRIDPQQQVFFADTQVDGGELALADAATPDDASLADASTSVVADTEADAPDDVAVAEATDVPAAADADPAEDGPVDAEVLQPDATKCETVADCVGVVPAGPCAVAACAAGTCVASPVVGAVCDDANVCTAQDACTAKGVCSGIVDLCDDGVLCTVDGCSPASGCVHELDPLPCQDGDPCTGDACDAQSGCIQVAAPSGPCNDGNACTTGDVCKSGECVGVVKACAKAAPCQLATCDSGTGTCTSNPQVNGAACDDGNACSQGDQCKGGVCVGQKNPCDDGNLCTFDACEAGGGCANSAQNGACNADSNACTDPDQCQAGACIAGKVKVCDDKNPCTVDACDAVKGCTTQALAKGTPCGTDLWCLTGQCVKVVVPPGMVYVAAGTFAMGCNATVDTQCKSDEKPAHDVDLGSFFVDKLEVSAAQYKACVTAGACVAPQKGTADETWNVVGKEQHPINFVTWAQAGAYCTFAGGSRLCTEAEWEFAARGKDGRRYPWGNAAPTCELANFAGCAVKGLKAVGSSKGASPTGGLDLAGNVREWTADWYGAAYYTELAKAGKATAPQGPATGTGRVTRGGQWLDSAPELRTSGRSFATPATGAVSVGIRCCRSPK